MRAAGLAVATGKSSGKTTTISPNPAPVDISETDAQPPLNTAAALLYEAVAGHYLGRAMGFSDTEFCRFSRHNLALSQATSANSFRFPPGLAQNGYIHSAHNEIR